MCKFMKALVTSVGDDELTVEERNLLSVAYKNVIGAKRASWRTLNVDEHKETELVQKYRKKVEEELSVICTEVLDLLHNILIPNSKTNGDTESQVFYLKMCVCRIFSKFHVFPILPFFCQIECCHVVS